MAPAHPVAGLVAMAALAGCVVPQGPGEPVDPFAAFQPEPTPASRVPGVKQAVWTGSVTGAGVPGTPVDSGGERYEFEIPGSLFQLVVAVQLADPALLELEVRSPSGQKWSDTNLGDVPPYPAILTVLVQGEQPAGTWEMFVRPVAAVGADFTLVAQAAYDGPP